MWKKKYFQEKKKTPAIEERSTQLKTDLELIHGKILQIIEQETKNATQAGNSKEADLGVRRKVLLIEEMFIDFFLKNLILKIVRLQHELQGFQQQFDQAKLRLTTDLKVTKDLSFLV